MRRLELFEIHDHPLFPQALRDLVTEALEALWDLGNSYGVIVPRLYAAIRAAHPAPAEAVALDLCSGGGGPWAGLARQIALRYSCRVRVCLTDKYPNHEAQQRMETLGTGDIRYAGNPIDAQHVPPAMRGFRTMFSSFHHFGPQDARAVLQDAVAGGQGIGVFEVPMRHWRTLLAVSLTPFLVMALTPAMRPFRWSRLLWTYLLPVVPFVIGFDGWASCFRAYSLQQLREMADEVPGFAWEAGVERGGLLPVVYLVGVQR